MDGKLLFQHGRGVFSYTLREICNIAYSIQVEDMTTEYRMAWAAGVKMEQTLDEQIQSWEERTGLRFDPAAHAMEMHKAWLEARGIPWDDTPVSDTALGAELWKTQDQEIPGVFMGDPKDPARRGR